MATNPAAPMVGQPFGQQQQLHPTVSYGQPGGEQAQILPQGAQRQVPQHVQGQQQYNQQQYSQQQVPQAPQMQQPQMGYGLVAPQGQQPNYPQQQQMQQQQPQQQMQPQQGYMQQQAPQQQLPQGYQVQYLGQQAPMLQQQQMQQGQQFAGQNMVLDGPGVPPDLRGRTVGNLVQVADQLAREVTTVRMQQPQQQRGPQQYAQQSQQQSPQQQQQAPQQRQGFWQNPDQRMDQVSQQVSQQVQQAIAPVLERNNREAVRDTITSVASQMPDFEALYPHMREMLQGATPELLTNPEIWTNAADLIRGKMARGAYGTTQQPQQGGFQQQPQGFQQPSLQQAPRSVPAGMQVLPQHAFFTEGPTGSQPHNSYQLSPDEAFYANKFGMSPDAFHSWKYGNGMGQQQQVQQQAQQQYNAGGRGW